ncbi:MAG TPA: BsuBI/PstI family type II restriction endonuclease [Caulobacteraceae bacterium]|nr:BsuBI/PstI family type II restriction endonuclease [Caulobacteraceae bacterium]
MSLPDLSSRSEIHRRLRLVFPEGCANRGWLTRELAASTVFVALYIGAIEGEGVFLAPKHVYRMTDEQSLNVAAASRSAYATGVLRARFLAPGRRWYQDTTREPIRDETLREGLVTVGAAIERVGLATTSSRPRYALTKAFAALFAPGLNDEAFHAAATSWRDHNLSPGALARIALVRAGAASSGDFILATFPSGEVRRMKPGPSSIITKAVVGVFAKRFLGEAAVLLVSDSGVKVVARDDHLARRLGFEIKADKDLPDIILVDLARRQPLLVFVEVVATDGPMSERRKHALTALVAAAGYDERHTAFVTAYLDRSGGAFRRTVAKLAWGSYAWFASEPEGLLELTAGTGTIG